MNVRRGLLIAIMLAVALGVFSRPAVAEAPYTITVKIMADDKEPAVRRVWEKRYRDRLAAASDIIQRCCNIRFKVVAVGTWTSSDDLHDLGQLMREFMHEVRPEPAQLVIGFTGQYRSLQQDKHIGGAKGPFCPYILIREWGRQITDSERLEILVHELGHYLGAAHSPDSKSVMRPDISDRQSRARSFKIGFDTVNARILRIIGDELRKRPVGYLAQLHRRRRSGSDRCTGGSPPRCRRIPPRRNTWPCWTGGSAYPTSRPSACGPCWPARGPSCRQ